MLSVSDCRLPWMQQLVSRAVSCLAMKGELSGVKEGAVPMSVLGYGECSVSGPGLGILGSEWLPHATSELSSFHFVPGQEHWPVRYAPTSSTALPGWPYFTTNH